VLTHNPLTANNEDKASRSFKILGVWEVYVEVQHRTALELALKEPLIYYQTAKDNITNYEQQLREHEATVANLRYFSAKGIEPHVLDSMARAQSNTTIRSLALQHQTNNQPTLLAIEDTRYDSEVHFITTTEMLDTAKAFVDNELKGYYHDSTELGDEERATVEFTKVTAAIRKRIPQVIIAPTTMARMSNGEWPALEPKSKQQRKPRSTLNRGNKPRAQTNQRQPTTDTRASARSGGDNEHSSGGYGPRSTPAYHNAWANRSTSGTALTQNTEVTSKARNVFFFCNGIHKQLGTVNLIHINPPPSHPLR
jgi:hypothetical protein